MDFSIGELSRRTAVKVPTIRYYEQIGLLPEPPRTEGQQRRYDKDAVARLAFIRHARELGFDLDAIRTLMSLQDNPTIHVLKPTRSPRLDLWKSTSALLPSARCVVNCAG
jgi:DNA-binding transcriptional MerR regulator